jgi:hypothetical protein
LGISILTTVDWLPDAAVSVVRRSIERKVKVDGGRY